MIRSLALTLLLLCASIHAAVHRGVHRVDVIHQHVPITRSADHQNRIQLAEKHMNAMTAMTDVATKEPFTVVDYGYSIVGNVSLGSPAQNFTLNFDFDSPNLYVVDANAVYYSDCQNASNNVAVTDKQTYDASATSSCVSVNANFSSSWPYLNGSVVSDVLQVGDSLQATVTFEDASQVDPYMQYNAYDGTFGLSMIPDENTTTTLLGQLQSSLDSPVYTLSLDSCPGFVNCTGQITLGGLAPDMCQSDSWADLAAAGAVPSYSTMPVFNATSLSTTAVGDNSGCAYRVDIPMRVNVWAGFDMMYTSYQVRELFVQASNASYNFTTWDYELTDDQLALAQPVQLNLANGAVLQLNPEDYTMPSDKTGMNYLNIYGYYDARERSQPSISLGMSFLSHYCLSKNFQTGVWSLASRV